MKYFKPKPYKSKFDKRKCMKCVYKCTMSLGSGAKASPNNVACYYSVMSNNGSCLELVKGKLVDRRGNDHDNCKLFKAGLRDKHKNMY